MLARPCLLPSRYYITRRCREGRESCTVTLYLSRCLPHPSVTGLAAVVESALDPRSREEKAAFRPGESYHVAKT